jgi:multiple sugar transport system substrate-binding protein
MASGNFSRRRFLELAGLMTCGGILAACAGGQATQPPAAATQPAPVEEKTVPPAPAGATKISYWHFWGGRWGEFQQQIVDDFNKEQDKIFVEVLIVPWGDLNPKLLTAISAGTPPDCAVIGRSGVAAWALQNALMVMDDYVAASTRIKEEDYFPIAWKECIYRGKQYALPFESGTYAFRWNQQIFEEVGLDPKQAPAKWSEIDIMAEKTTKGDKEKGYERFGFCPWKHRLDLIGWLAGGDWYDPQNEKMTIDREENIRAFEWFKQYADKYGTEKIEEFWGALPEWATENDPFNQGLIVMGYSGSWELSIVAEYKPDLQIGVAANPPADEFGKTVSINQGSACVLPRGSAHPAEGFEFLSWHSAVGVGKWIPNAADMASRYDQKDILPAIFPDEQRWKDYWKVYYDMLEVAYHEPMIPVLEQFNTELGRARDAVIYGQKTPAEALKEAQQIVQAELEKALAAAGAS